VTSIILLVETFLQSSRLLLQVADVLCFIVLWYLYYKLGKQLSYCLTECPMFG